MQVPHNIFCRVFLDFCRLFASGGWLNGRLKCKKKNVDELFVNVCNVWLCGYVHCRENENFDGSQFLNVKFYEKCTLHRNNIYRGRCTMVQSLFSHFLQLNKSWHWLRWLRIIVEIKRNKFTYRHYWNVEESFKCQFDAKRIRWMFRRAVTSSSILGRCDSGIRSLWIHFIFEVCFVCIYQRQFEANIYFVFAKNAESITKFCEKEADRRRKSRRK